MPVKRLFLFASFSNSGMLGKAEVNYLHALADVGDVIFFCDSDLKPGELVKVQNHTIHAEAFRHGEYDFGSYKRGFEWAIQNLDVVSYDYLYLVNDSVFCLVKDLTPFLDVIERGGNKFIGMVFFPNRIYSHLQSWFVGIGREMFMRTEFQDFIRSVQEEENKDLVCIKYENGLTKLAASFGFTPYALLQIGRKGIYNTVRRNVRHGLPFIKKVSFIRHNCSLSAQIKDILACTPDNLAKDILDEIKQEYGNDIYNCILSGTFLNCVLREVSYNVRKICRH